MASTKVSLTQHFMRSFLHDPFSAGNRILTDAEAKGLELRVQGKKAAWVARYRKKLPTLGYAAVPEPKKERRMLTSAVEARALNNVVRGLIDRDPALVEPFLANFYSVTNKHGQRDMALAMEATEEAVARERAERVHDTAWTLRQAVDNWIAKRSRPGKKKTIKDTYAAEVRSVFARQEFRKYLDMPITKLNSKIGETIRDEVEKNSATPGKQGSGVSPSKKAVSCIRSVLSYTFENHRGQSGLDGREPWWLMLSTDTVIEPREREPSIDDIGTVLALGEYFLDHRLPGRTGVQHGVRDNIFGAFLWILLSAQRVTAGLSLQYHGVKPWGAEGREGWFVANWDAGVQKNGKRFVLPIAPLAAETLMYYMEKARHVGNSKWAFPSEDGKDANGNDIKVNRRSTLAFIERLAGRDKPSEKRACRVNLLELNGVSYWSQHDVRRALTTALDAAGAPGGASAVLTHTIDAGAPQEKMSDAKWEEWMRNRVAKITVDSYGQDIQHLKLKSETMTIWTNAIFDAWNRARSRALFIDLNKTVVVADLPIKSTRSA